MTLSTLMLIGIAVLFVGFAFVGWVICAQGGMADDQHEDMMREEAMRTAAQDPSPGHERIGL